MIVIPQRISDALAKLLASGDVEEVRPGLYMLTAKGLARAQRLLDAGELPVLAEADVG